MYNHLYSPANYALVQPSRFYLASKQVTINGSTFISTNSRSKRSSGVIAHWPEVLNRIDSRGEAPLRAGVVTYFFRHELKLKQRTAESVVNTTNILAHVMWLESHPYRDNSFQQQLTFLMAVLVLYQLQELLVINCAI